MPLSSRIAVSAVRCTDSGLQWSFEDGETDLELLHAWCISGNIPQSSCCHLLCPSLRSWFDVLACLLHAPARHPARRRLHQGFRTVFLFAWGTSPADGGHVPVRGGFTLLYLCFYPWVYSKTKERKRKEIIIKKKDKERKKDRVQRGRCGLLFRAWFFACRDPARLVRDSCGTCGWSMFLPFLLRSLSILFFFFFFLSFFFFSFLFLGFRRPLYLMSRRAAVWATSRSSAPRRANSGNDGHGTAPCDPVVCGSEYKLVLHLDLCAKPHRRNGMWQQLASCRRRRCVENWLESPKRLVSHASCFFQAPVILSFHDQCQRCCHWGVFFQLSALAALWPFAANCSNCSDLFWLGRQECVRFLEQEKGKDVKVEIVRAHAARRWKGMSSAPAPGQLVKCSSRIALLTRLSVVSIDVFSLWLQVFGVALDQQKLSSHGVPWIVEKCLAFVETHGELFVGLSKL